MKVLHVIKSVPDADTKTLIQIISEGEQTTELALYDDADYDKLIDLIFEHDKVITWW